MQHALLLNRINITETDVSMLQ